MRCLDADASKAMVAEIDQAHKDGDTLGGVVEVLAYGVPVGLGSHVHWDRRLDARLAAALMGIQAIKGVEVGDGFDLARVPGSQAHDEIVNTAEGVRRTSGRSGGTEGGLTTGELLRVRAAMKPIATVPRALATVDVATGEAAKAHHQRSDVCAVPAAGIVAEAMVALVLADAVAEKFGGDSVARDPPQRRSPTSTTCRSGERTGPAGRPGRPDGLGQVHRRARCWPSGSARPTGTPTPTSWPPRAARSRTSSSRTASRTSARWSGPRYAPRWPGTRACSSLGGGAILDAGTRALLAPHPVVYLSMDVEEAVKRVGLNAARPLLAVNPRRQWRELMDARRPLYTEVARAVVATDGRTPEEVAQAVLDALELKDA